MFRNMCCLSLSVSPAELVVPLLVLVPATPAVLTPALATHQHSWGQNNTLNINTFQLTISPYLGQDVSDTGTEP